MKTQHPQEGENGEGLSPAIAETLPDVTRRIYFNQNKNWTTQTLIKAENGELGGLKQILDWHPEYISDVDSSNSSVLLKACETAQTQIVRYLVSQEGIEIDVERNQYTPLLAICRYIADPRMLDKQNHYLNLNPVALREKYVDIVKILLNAGANPNQSDIKLHTALHYLVMCWENAQSPGHIKAIQNTIITLLEHGANPGLTTTLGRSVYTIAKNAGVLEPFEELVKTHSKEYGSDLLRPGDKGYVPVGDTPIEKKNPTPTHDYQHPATTKLIIPETSSSDAEVRIENLNNISIIMGGRVIHLADDGKEKQNWRERVAKEPQQSTARNITHPPKKTEIRPKPKIPPSRPVTNQTQTNNGKNNGGFVDSLKYYTGGYCTIL